MNGFGDGDDMREKLRGMKRNDKDFTKIKRH
jgi:hypothetical protein